MVIRGGADRDTSRCVGPLRATLDRTFTPSRLALARSLARIAISPSTFRPRRNRGGGACTPLPPKETMWRIICPIYDFTTTRPTSVTTGVTFPDSPLGWMECVLVGRSSLSLTHTLSLALSLPLSSSPPSLPLSLFLLPLPLALLPYLSLLVC